MKTVEVTALILFLCLVKTSNATSKVCKVATTHGACCVFPFIYKKKSYQSCTSVDNGGVLWCSKTSNYDSDKQWGNCKISVCKVATTHGACCVFPFIYKKKSYQSCTSVDNGGVLWCSKTSNYDSDKQWGNCKISVCKVATTHGACCVFPFIYKKKSYQSCTSVDNGGVLWCSKTSNYDSDKKWGNCKISVCKVATTHGACCVFPFIYKKKSYQSCTSVDNGGVLWCSKTSNYDSDKKWGNCKISVCNVATAHGACCVFPFIYKKKSYQSCTSVDNGGVLWCSKTSNYDSDKQWGNCKLSVGARVLARWTNNLYYKARVASISKDLIHIQFDDGDKIIHQSKDVSAVIPDTIPSNVEFKDHVIASWKGGNKHYIGFVIGVDHSRGYKVRFDDNDEAWYTKEKLRIFPDMSSPHTLGSRVFARWTNGLYYRGFVTEVFSSTVFINYDDGDKITLLRNDPSAVIADKIPASNELQLGQKVIGYWPWKVRYYPGTVSAKPTSFKYFIKFDDGDKRWNTLYEIRSIPQH